MPYTPIMYRVLVELALEGNLVENADCRQDGMARRSHLRQKPAKHQRQCMSQL